MLEITPNGYLIMKNFTPTTFPLPERLEDNYNQLMRSRESFMKRLSPAEEQELQSLYNQLNYVWNQINLKILKEILEQRALELKNLQGLQNQDWQKWKENKRQVYIQNLKERKLELKKLCQENERLRKNLNVDIMSWKTDILRRQVSLT